MASGDPQSTNTHSSQSETESDIILQLPNNIAVRRYRKTDVQSQARSGNNKNVHNNLSNRMPQPYTEADAAEWIERNTNPANFVPSGPWTFETGSQGPRIPSSYTITVDDESVGSIGLVFGDTKDVHLRTAEIGYWLGEEHWGKGVMSAVVPAFVQWTWRTFEVLIRVEADAYERNTSSQRILMKAGLQLEGRKKWAYLKNGEVGDLVILGMTRPGLEKP